MQADISCTTTAHLFFFPLLGISWIGQIFVALALYTYLLSNLLLLVTLLLQELLELEALQLHLPLSLVLKDALVGLHHIHLKIRQ